jgi:hypothetical protein
VICQVQNLVFVCAGEVCHDRSLPAVAPQHGTRSHSPVRSPPNVPLGLQ